MENVQIKRLASESFTDLANARDHYYLMIENLKVIMLDGLKRIPPESMDKKSFYEGNIRIIEAAVDAKIESYSKKNNSFMY